jgi:hypothetical protein
MALSNLSLLLSTALGGGLYDYFSVTWDHRFAFNALVAVGALFRSDCRSWLVEPRPGH